MTKYNKQQAISIIIDCAAKYEENLNLRFATDKKKYSDIALKLLSYIKDEVEHASYEEKIAKRLNVEVSILREKGDRLHKKLEQDSTRKYLKKPKTSVTPDHIKKLEDSLLALKLFGGISKTDIPLEVPSDDTRIDELELIFANDHEGITNPNYEKEAADLMKRYIKEMNKLKISELNEKLANLSEDDDEYIKIIHEINNLQKNVN